MAAAVLLKFVILCLAIVFQFVSSVPVPEPSGWHDKHEHHVIHVPYQVHHVHHYHKVPVYVKSKPIIITTKSHDDWDWSSGSSSGASSGGWDWD